MIYTRGNKVIETLVLLFMNFETRSIYNGRISFLTMGIARSAFQHQRSKIKKLKIYSWCHVSYRFLVLSGHFGTYFRKQSRFYSASIRCLPAKVCLCPKKWTEQNKNADLARLNLYASSFSLTSSGRLTN